MSMDLYADIYWGIQVEKYVVDRLLGRGAAAVEEAELVSSIIRRARYHAVKDHLLLEFESGQWHRYEGVPAKVFRGLKKSKSPGSYFTRSIKTNFSSVTVSPEEAECKPAFTSVYEMKKKEGVEVTEYSEGRAYFSNENDGYLIGFTGRGFSGGGPVEFDPSSYKVERGWRKKLDQFCQKYEIVGDEPRWYIYVRGSN